MGSIFKVLSWHILLGEFNLTYTQGIFCLVWCENTKHFARGLLLVDIKARNDGAVKERTARTSTWKARAIDRRSLNRL